MSPPSPVVVKLGGSHAMQPHLKDWLRALVACRGRVAVVAGGGPFADAVRAAQSVIGFDDRAAHHMALLAMEQFGVAIAALDEAFVCASEPAAIRIAADEGRVPVWMPTRMALADADLPQTWDLTSDSLSAWLAGRLSAQRLVMVKHRSATGGSEAVDPLFWSFAERAGLECTFLGALDAGRLAEAIDSPGRCRSEGSGVPVDRQDSNPRSCRTSPECDIEERRWRPSVSRRS